MTLLLLIPLAFILLLLLGLAIGRFCSLSNPDAERQEAQADALLYPRDRDRLGF